MYREVFGGFRLRFFNIMEPDDRKTPYSPISLIHITQKKNAIKMNTFLRLVAKSLLAPFDGQQMVDLSKTIIIFPNNRAKLFLNKYLMELCGGRPIWAPTYTSISSFFKEQASSVHVEDKICTIARLFRHYKRLVNPNATLDNFYGWGERILNDFDDVDKNMGPVENVFCDLNDYQSLSTQEDWMSNAEDRDEMEAFFGSFSSEKQSEVRENYKKLWKQYHALYNNLREELKSKNLAYEGMLYREVVEALEEDREAGRALRLKSKFRGRTFVLVGFNVLDRVEEQLFRLLKDEGMARFYWDYDTYYVEKVEGKYKANNEAGLFMAQNLNNFGNELERDIVEGVSFDNISRFAANDDKHKLTFVEADTDAIQAQYIAPWLNGSDTQHIDPAHANQTAIVLGDETMLQPTLHALPFKALTTNGATDEEANNEVPSYYVNITKGFPVNYTSAYADLVKMMEDVLSGAPYDDEKHTPTLHTLPTTDEMIRVLRSFQARIQETAQLTAPSLIDEQLGEDSEQEGEDHEEVESETWLNILHTESNVHLYNTINKFISLLESDEHLLAQEVNSMVACLSYKMLFNLMRQNMQQSQVPFHGEPAIGLQVMGVLETRCLDFKHVLLLSANEGVLPKKANDASFIPFIIRKHYGLTTFTRKTAVYAYYFYRLLQRAETVTMVYNCSTQGTHRGEMTRFMRHLLTDGKMANNIMRIHLTAAPKASAPAKDIEIDHTLQSRAFSPSALNTYLHCPREFYYHYVANIITPDDRKGIIDARDFGTVVHKAAELFYDEHKHGVSPKELEALLDNATDKGINAFVKKAFDAEKVSTSDYTEELVRNTFIKLLKYDASEKSLVDSFTFLKGEYDEAKATFMIENHETGELEPVTVYGTIDRLDMAYFKDNSDFNMARTLRVIDYKTGGCVLEADNVDALFNNRLIENGKEITDRDKNPKYLFQAFAYSLLMLKNPQKLANEIKGAPIVPTLYYIGHMDDEIFTPYLRVNKTLITDFRAQLADEFEEKLELLLEEIINDKNFLCAESDESCTYCNFKQLCAKGRNARK